jgi:hypothetical protein
MFKKTFKNVFLGTCHRVLNAKGNPQANARDAMRPQALMSVSSSIYAPSRASKICQE